MKTPTIIGLVCVVLGLGATVATLIITGHDPSAFVAQLPLLLAVGASLFGLDKVTKNTNGTLSSLQAKLDAATKENAALRSVSTPEQIAQVAPVVPVHPTAPAAPVSDPISVILPDETGATVPATAPATINSPADAEAASGANN